MSKAYSSSGVSLNRAYRILDIIAKKNSRPVSHFATTVKIPKGAKELVFSADGVGTKIELLAEAGLNHVSGWDCVAMNVNDLLCQGAQPLWFLDYYSQNELEPKVFEQALGGMKAALKAVGAELAGGETAELPGIFARNNIYELAGFVAGVKDPRWNLSVERVKPGDSLVGIPSFGPHSNGFSLIRKSLNAKEIREHAQELLGPTRLYHPIVWPLLKKPGLVKNIHSMAHITGGGFVEKLARAMKENCQAVVELKSWPLPAVFEFLTGKAGIGMKEGCAVWNMGIGFVLVAEQKSFEAIKAAIPEALLIGRVGKRSPGQSAVSFLD